MRTLSKRTIAPLLVTLLALPVVAPAAAVAQDDEAAEDVTLTVWSWRPEDEDAYNAIFDVYEEANPGVTVEFVPFVNTDYNNILATGLTGDGGPDVAQVRSYGGVQPLIEAGQLLPLDGEIETLANFPPLALKSQTGQSDGLVYGVPIAYQAFTAFYNKGIFDELGLEEPQTWDEFVSVLDTLAENDYIPISSPAKDNWMIAIVMDAIGAPRYGGQQFEADVLSGATDFNDPDYVAAIELMNWLLPYLPEDVIGVSYDDSRTLFITELAGIFIGGSFEIGYWRENGPDLDIGVFQVPAPPESLAPASVVGWYDGAFGVNANSDSTEAALDLVEWMGTQEFGQLYTENVKQLSAVPGTTPEDPLLAEFGELFTASPVSYLHLVNFRYDQPTGDSLLRDGVTAMWLGEKTAEEVAADVQTGLEQWFTPGE